MTFKRLQKKTKRPHTIYILTHEFTKDRRVPRRRRYLIWLGHGDRWYDSGREQSCNEFEIGRVLCTGWAVKAGFHRAHIVDRGRGSSAVG